MSKKVTKIEYWSYLAGDLIKHSLLQSFCLYSFQFGDNIKFSCTVCRSISKFSSETWPSSAAQLVSHSPNCMRRISDYLLLRRKEWDSERAPVSVFTAFDLKESLLNELTKVWKHYALFWRVQQLVLIRLRVLQHQVTDRANQNWASEHLHTPFHYVHIYLG